MKVGVLQFFSWPERRVPLEAVYARALEPRRRDGGERLRRRLARRAPLHVVQRLPLRPHDGDPRRGADAHGCGSAPPSRSPPLYHPLRLAEEVALLDVLSGGPRELGRRAWLRERASSRPSACRWRRARARLLESLEIVVAGVDLRNGSSTTAAASPPLRGHRGAAPSRCRSRTRRWLAASSPDAIRRGGGRGVSEFLMDPHASHADIGREARAVPRHAGPARTLRPRRRPRDLPIARLIAVAEDRGGGRPRRPGRRRSGRSPRTSAVCAPPRARFHWRRRLGRALPPRRRDRARHARPPSSTKSPRLREEIGLEYLLLRAAEPPDLHAVHGASAAEAALSGPQSRGFCPFRKSTRSSLTRAACSCCTQCPAPSSRWQPTMRVHATFCIRSTAPGH